ncbi:MAG: type IV toxin-antitoxin system AbiEi family antitoxin domain-containing protein [Actinomycetota bacterium]|nr:type IV toxin-antitoxin system AbiEi family antitoxin domain-containing protein [Actinomycetota bacterium]
MTRAQAVAEGMSPSQVTRAATTGAWERVHPGVYHLRGSPLTAQASLLAACLATGGRASHESAAWQWGLLAHPPPQPTVSVAATARGRKTGVVVHRIRDLTPQKAPTWQGIPCTDPVRTVMDLAGVVPRGSLDAAVDLGLALRRFTVDDLATELDRRSRRGRAGAGLLRAALLRRGHLGAPHPSVLESRLLRLLACGGIRPGASRSRCSRAATASTSGSMSDWPWRWTASPITPILRP